MNTAGPTDPDHDATTAGSPETRPDDVLDTTALRREILRLAVPALLTLVAEPLFLLADTSIVGHLGTTPLAGLGVASTILGTAVGVFVFLAYATTALVSRRLGAGAEDAALAAGLDGLWLALLLGVGTGLVLGVGAPALVGLFGVDAAVAAQAVAYLQISALGVPAMLAVLALTGVLRGLQDTRTPLVAATLGFGANILLNTVLVYGAGLGIAGSAWGTVAAQTGMAVGLGIVVFRAARRHGARLRPHPGAVTRAAASGVPLLLRTLSLRAVVLLTTWVAAHYGATTLAAHQVAWTLWTFLSFALDALAIAGQALIGKALGAGDVVGTRAMTELMSRWSRGFGVVLGLALAALSPVLPWLFTTDPGVRAALTVGILVLAAGQPVAAQAFLLDGVLIGAGDARWLARVGLLLLIVYLPVVGILVAVQGPLEAAGSGAALAAIWAGFQVFMIGRAVVLTRRARQDTWLVTGLQ
ncbi:MATE family efflux transporter [Mobilicoccus pelagius]|uniref:Putative MatE family transporter n=1 Tax=Mobilicoccus pelagius NBRC 104925 TaxID=1089455 RepID=H5UT06_9MICO|nr:putative MatE family transporter [Mobilicoccus pelagius NBRC 104925]